eukprot:TRINITY_DN5557_c0_g1_i2.p1 TRINITY_DN5557_c0_g1~~TRINITY_DN5557_c0_g1_i2.p1  ORF type:complete len:1495 (+),score=205.90 TRINITY_DN5557_c0_g1_i2:117-4601(+)
MKAVGMSKKQVAEEELRHIFDGRLNGKWRANEPCATQSGRHMQVRLSYVDSVIGEPVQFEGDCTPQQDSCDQSRFDDEDDYQEHVSTHEHPTEVPHSRAAGEARADSGRHDVLRTSAVGRSDSSRVAGRLTENDDRSGSFKAKRRGRATGGNSTYSRDLGIHTIDEGSNYAERARATGQPRSRNSDGHRCSLSNTSAPEVVHGSSDSERTVVVDISSAEESVNSKRHGHDNTDALLPRLLGLPLRRSSSGTRAKSSCAWKGTSQFDSSQIVVKGEQAPVELNERRHSVELESSVDAPMSPSAHCRSSEVASSLNRGIQADWEHLSIRASSCDERETKFTSARGSTQRLEGERLSQSAPIDADNSEVSQGTMDNVESYAAGGDVFNDESFVPARSTRGTCAIRTTNSTGPCRSNKVERASQQRNVTASAQQACKRTAENTGGSPRQSRGQKTTDAVDICSSNRLDDVNNRCDNDTSRLGSQKATVALGEDGTFEELPASIRKSQHQTRDCSTSNEGTIYEVNCVGGNRVRGTRINDGGETRNTIKRDSCLRGSTDRPPCQSRRGRESHADVSSFPAQNDKASLNALQRPSEDDSDHRKDDVTAACDHDNSVSALSDARDTSSRIVSSRSSRRSSSLPERKRNELELSQQDSAPGSTLHGNRRTDESGVGRTSAVLEPHRDASRASIDRAELGDESLRKSESSDVVGRRSRRSLKTIRPSHGTMRTKTEEKLDPQADVTKGDTLSDSEATHSVHSSDSRSGGGSPLGRQTSLRRCAKVPLRSSKEQAKSLVEQADQIGDERSPVAAKELDGVVGQSSSRGGRIDERSPRDSQPVRRVSSASLRGGTPLGRRPSNLESREQQRSASLEAARHGFKQDQSVSKGSEINPAVDGNALISDPVGRGGHCYHRAECRYTRREDAQYVGLDIQLPCKTMQDVSDFEELRGPERSRVQLQLDLTDEALGAMLGANRRVDGANTSSTRLPHLLSKLCKEFAVHFHDEMEAPIGEKQLAVDGVPATLAMLLRIVELLDALISNDGGDVCQSGGVASSAPVAGAAATDSVVRGLSDCAGFGGILPLCIHILCAEVASPSINFNNEWLLHAIIAVRLLVEWLPPLGVPRPRGQLHASGGYDALVKLATDLLRSLRGEEVSTSNASVTNGHNGRSLGVASTLLAQLAMVLDSLRICCGSHEFVADLASGRTNGARRGLNGLHGSRGDGPGLSDSPATLAELSADALDYLATLPFMPITRVDGSGVASVAIDAAAAAATRLLATSASLPSPRALSGTISHRTAVALSHLLGERPMTLRLVVAIRGLACSASQAGYGGGPHWQAVRTESFLQDLHRTMAAEGVAAGCVRAVRHSIDVAKSANSGCDEESLDGTFSEASALVGQGIQAAAAGAAAHLTLFGALYNHVEAIVRSLDACGGRGCGGEASAQLKKMLSEDMANHRRSVAATADIAEEDDAGAPPQIQRKSSVEGALKSLRRSIRRACIAPYLRL